MSLALLLAGIALVVFVFVDAVWTTLGLHQAGPIAGRVAGWTWQGLTRLHRAISNHAFLASAGTVTLLAVAFTWVLLLFGGWFLIFLSDPDAVVAADTGLPADSESRFYFVGYTLVTLGIGDYVPTGGWKAVTILCSVHGLFELTLAISYLLPVLGSATESRQLASSITGLGNTPQEILTRSWTGTDFGNLSSHLESISSELGFHVHAHQAYPILHYFHAMQPESSPPLRIAVLNEAVTLLECGIREDARPAPPTLHAVRFTLTQYLRLLNAVYVAPSDDPPPPPDLRPLRAAGIPCVTDAEFEERLAEEAERRRVLWGRVQHDGWTWEDVQNESEERSPEGVVLS
ncbi:MAG: ion channel [Rhodothermales bacterium]|nr:ion channel [Rhodothermales bacterium]